MRDNSIKQEGFRMAERRMKGKDGDGGLLKRRQKGETIFDQGMENGRRQKLKEMNKI